jgi:hypothetical protein
MDKSDLVELFRASAAAVTRGDAAAAERIYRGLLEVPAAVCSAALPLGHLLETQGRLSEAIDVYQRAEKAGCDGAETLLVCTRLRQRFGLPAIPAATPGPRVQMSNLGYRGRFGNQLLQYAFLRLYAKRQGVAFAAPNWVGRYLYASDYQLPAGELPTVDEGNADLFAVLRGERPGPVDCDLTGFFCVHTREWGDAAGDFRALFRIAPLLAGRFANAFDALRQDSRTVVAIHLRRGDFGYGPFWIAPCSWYLEWLQQLWPTLRSPVLYLATDDAHVARRFAAYSPLLAQDLPTALAEVPYALDHYVLSHADRVAISNSTFSFTAAMLNETCSGFFRPDPQQHRLCSFDPWNSPLLIAASEEPQTLPPHERQFIERVIAPGTTLVHMGPYCSAWTNATRRIHKTTRVHEIEPGESIGDLRNRLTHISLLRVDAHVTLASFLADVREALTLARIDMIHFAPRTDAVLAGRVLGQTGYRCLELRADGSLRLVTEPAAGASFVALQERLLYLFAHIGPSRLDLAPLCRLHNITVDTVLQLGADESGQLANYAPLGARRVIVIEARPGVYARLKERAAGNSHVKVVLHALTDSDLPSAGSGEVPAGTLAGLMAELGVAPTSVSLLAVNAPEAEHVVLRAAGAVLGSVGAVVTEMRFATLPTGAAQIEEVHQLLAAAGLQRVAIISGHDASRAEAFYVRRELQNVPT